MFPRGYVRDNSFFPLIGEVYFVNFPETDGIIKGWHPGIICQNNLGNRYGPNVIAIPVTSKVERLDIQSNVLLPVPEVGLYHTSMAVCGSLQTVPKQDVGDFITMLPVSYMKKIARACNIAMPLIAYLSEADIKDIRTEAMFLSGYRSEKS